MVEKQKPIPILHLARWYPHREDPMPGLFVQRHIEAAALFSPQTVIYPHATKNIKGTSSFEVESEFINKVYTIRVYYAPPRIKIPGLRQALSLWRFYKAVAKGFQAAKKENRRFDLVHVHVLTRLGLVALYLKMFRGLPYVISEHWSRYLPTTDGYRGIGRKMTTRWVVKQAEAVTTVTQNLSDAMQNHHLFNRHYVVLENVVDPIFYDADLKTNRPSTEKFQMVHVSCFEDRSKNISGLLRVIQALKKTRSDFHFLMIGDGMDFDEMKAYAIRLELTDEYVSFTGLQTGATLAKSMQSGHALVMFSHFENLPVVINESLVLGVPVLSSDVGGISEYIHSENGVLVPAGDEKRMVEALNKFMNHPDAFDSSLIAKQARTRFSPKTIGQKLNTLYLNGLKNRKRRLK